MKKPKISKLATKIIKSKTNDGANSKLYIKILAAKGFHTAISVTKLVLTNKDFGLFERYGFENLKTFKEYILYKQVFSIKLKTLGEINEWIFDTLNQSNK